MARRHDKRPLIFGVIVGILLLLKSLAEEDTTGSGPREISTRASAKENRAAKRRSEGMPRE